MLLGLTLPGSSYAKDACIINAFVISQDVRLIHAYYKVTFNRFRNLFVLFFDGWLIVYIIFIINF